MPAACPRDTTTTGARGPQPSGAPRAGRLVPRWGGPLDSRALVGARPRGGVPTDPDRAWDQPTITGGAAHDVPLLGFYLATRDGVFPLPEPLAAAS